MNKVLIVDDHPVIRLAVRMLMERHCFWSLPNGYVKNLSLKSVT